MRPICRRWGMQVLACLLVLTLFVGCGTLDVAIERPRTSTPSDIGHIAPTILTPDPVAPTTAPPRPAPSPTAVAPASAYTLHLGINQVQGLAFAGPDSLWAATTGGAVHWNLATNSHRHYTTADGLAADRVNDVARASNGDLWFATLGGVSHLDENGWTNYREADGLVDDAVQSIAIDKDGTVWAGTTEGVGRFDGASWTTQLPGDRAWEIAVAPDGAVWFANDAAGLRRYVPADDAWTTYAVSEDPQAPGVKTVAVGPTGEVWVYLGYDKVYRFDGEQWRAVHDAGGQWVCGVAFEVDDTPWIATCDGYRAHGEGLVTLEDGVWRHIGREEGLASDSVWAVAVGPRGQIAAGTDYGLSLYRNGTWQTLRDGPALNRIAAVAVTPDGSSWFGFGNDSFPPAGGGVSRFDGQRWDVANQTTGFPINDNVHLLAVDRDGRLWAAGGCELAYRDQEAWHRVAGCDDLRGNVIDVAFGPLGDVWVATDFNVYRFAGQSWTVWESLLPNAVAVTQAGVVLIGQSPIGEGGVWAYDGEGWQQLVDGPPCISEMIVDGEGMIWAVACEADTLYRRVDDTWEEITASDGLPPGRVADIAVSIDGEVWVATEAGVGYLGTAGWVVRQRTWEGDIRAMALAPDRSAWLATSRGAVRVHID